MSTRVGTLQPPRAGGSILLATFLVVVVLIAVVVISLDQGRQGETTVVGRSLVYGPVEDNTPSELSAGIVGGAEQTFVGGTAANTPSELSGWSSPPASRHKFITDTLGTNSPSELTGGIIGGIPPKFYERHQRG
jgi:hypothetical protein